MYFHAPVDTILVWGRVRMQWDQASFSNQNQRRASEAMEGRKRRSFQNRSWPGQPHPYLPVTAQNKNQNEKFKFSVDYAAIFSAAKQKHKIRIKPKNSNVLSVMQQFSQQTNRNRLKARTN